MCQNPRFHYCKISSFGADIIAEYNYYPFGMMQPGNYTEDPLKESYRYAFNGMEKDDEMKGIGNSYDYGARMYDSRLGRFYSTDPLGSEFPWNSSYAFAENSPILFIDFMGLGKATSQDSANAMQLIDNFANNQNTTTVWAQIPKKDFVNDLTRKIHAIIRKIGVNSLYLW